MDKFFVLLNNLCLLLTITCIAPEPSLRGTIGLATPVRSFRSLIGSDWFLPASTLCTLCVYWHRAYLAVCFACYIAFRKLCFLLTVVVRDRMNGSRLLQSCPDIYTSPDVSLLKRSTRFALVMWQTSDLRNEQDPSVDVYRDQGQWLKPRRHRLERVQLAKDPWSKLVSVLVLVMMISWDV